MTLTLSALDSEDESVLVLSSEDDSLSEPFRLAVDDSLSDAVAVNVFVFSEEASLSDAFIFSEEASLSAAVEPFEPSPLPSEFAASKREPPLVSALSDASSAAFASDSETLSDSDTLVLRLSDVLSDRLWLADVLSDAAASEVLPVEADKDSSLDSDALFSSRMLSLSSLSLRLCCCTVAP